jgi:hypothetical protein
MEAMEYELGDQAGAGSFRCVVCGFAVTLRERDNLPSCPVCASDRFEPAPLFAGDMQEMANQVASAAPEWLAETRDALSEPGDYLVFDDGVEIRTISLSDGWTRIGRSLSADIRIDDTTVSRRHALVHREGDVIRVLDDRSLNGILHNGRRTDIDELADGDTLTIGRFEIHYIHLTNDREPSLA